MPVRLPIFSEVPAHTYTIALDGVQYEIRLVYRARTASWYLDLRDENGVELVLGRRLSPGSSPTGGVIVDGPPGVIAPFGADPYDRHELELWYFEAAELAEARVAAVAQDRLPIELET